MLPFWGIGLLFALNAASAATSPVEADFIAACMQGFGAQSAQEAGREICSCAATESRHQKVTPARLKHETEEIRKDSKYQIQDKGVLASLHYCTIKMMHGAE